MRIVFVTPYPPSLVHSRSYVFATQLAKQHQVTVVCLCRTPRDISDVAKLRAHGILVTPVFEEGSPGTLRKAGALLGDRPLEVTMAKAKKLREALWAEIERGDVGVVHVEHLHAAMIARNLPVPTIWDAVASSARRVRLNNGRATSRMRRAIGSMELRRMQSYETRLLKIFRHVVVSTEAELTTVLDLRKTNDHFTPAVTDDSPTAHVLPAAIDTTYFSPSLARHHHNRLIFSGLLSEGQNRAAIELLLHTIMPRIWRVRPDVTLTIAGAEPPSALEELNDVRLSVTGYVEDLRPYLAGAAIAVSPLPYVVGTPTTILEAMAMGVPVVASDAACAGLRAIPGADLLVGGSPERFAHLIVRLLEDDALRHSLARNGRAYVERYHAAPLVCRQLEALYTVVSGHSFASSDATPLLPAPTRAAAPTRKIAAVGTL